MGANAQKEIQKMGLVNYLLDTSVIVDALRTQKLDALRFLQTNYKGKISISSLTIAELFSGASVQDKEVAAFLRLIIDAVRVVDTNAEIMITAGRLRFFNQIALADAIIAASAIEHGLTIVTHNKKDFQKIKGLKIIAPK